MQSINFKDGARLKLRAQCRKHNQLKFIINLRDPLFTLLRNRVGYIHPLPTARESTGGLTPAGLSAARVLLCAAVVRSLLLAQSVARVGRLVLGKDNPVSLTWLSRTRARMHGPYRAAAHLTYYCRIQCPLETNDPHSTPVFYLHTLITSHKYLLSKTNIFTFCSIKTRVFLRRQ